MNFSAKNIQKGATTSIHEDGSRIEGTMNVSRLDLRYRYNKTINKIMDF